MFIGKHGSYKWGNPSIIIRCLMVSTDQADPSCFMNIDGMTLISFFLSPPFSAWLQKYITI